MKEKINAYRPAAAAFLTMMAMALTSSTLSFFLEPICAVLEISRGSFSLIFSLMSLSGALLNPFLGQYVGKRGVGGVLLVCGIWTGGCMILLSLVKNLWMLYLTGFAMGALSSTCVALCANVIVQQSYFGAQASGILGGVMAGSGVGGMIFSIVIPQCMAGFGWQTALRVMGICWLVLLWTAALLLGKQSGVVSGSGNGAVGLGMTRAEALKSPKLYLQMVVIIIICACCGVQQQLPSLLSAYRFEEGTVSVMISVMTAFLAVGKVAQGILYGRLGVRRGGVLMMLVFAAGFLALLMPALAWPGLLLLSFGLGIYTTLLPQLTRRVFGSREYAAIWALIATAGSAGTFFANPLWGLIYDMTGSYAIGLAGAALLLIAAIWAMLLSLRESN